MARADSDGVGLYYETAGEGPTVAFLADAGLGAWSWGWQCPAVAGPYEALVADARGTGRSDAPPGPYDVGALAADLEAVLRDAGARRAHLVGCGLGAATALAYAREYDRARSLALLAAAPAGDRYDTATLARLFGDDWPEVAFSPAYRDAAPLPAIERWRREDDAPPAARKAQFAALESFDVRPLYEVTTPALVLGGVDDPVVPRAAGETVGEELPRGRFEAVEGRHLAHVEHSVAVNDALLGFLETHD